MEVEQMGSVFEKMRLEVTEASLDPETKQVLLQKIEDVQNKQINILITGATGVGKSSTINALFGKRVAVVGEGVDPETTEIQKYVLGNIVLWDSPGLGDSPQKDLIFSQHIVDMLQKKDDSGTALIDVVLVIVDSSARDMGTTYELINNLLIPKLPDTGRILIALNQCDIAMKGKYWDYSTNTPKEPLQDFLQEKIDSVGKRVQEATNVHVEPIYYSALHQYNISKLFLYLLESTPDEKRIIYADQLNKDTKVWQANDELKNYNIEIRKTMEFSFVNALEGAVAGAKIGAKIGSKIPIVGPIVGGVIGAVIGFIGGGVITSKV